MQNDFAYLIKFWFQVNLNDFHILKQNTDTVGFYFIKLIKLFFI